MKNIKLINLDANDHLVHPEEFDEITLTSPALSVFTDFKAHIPLEVEAHIPAIDAKYMMQKAHVRLKIVVDNSTELVGTISLSQLSNQNILIHQHKGLDRDDILVKHLMTPRAEVKVLTYKDITNSTIADIIEALKKHGTQHCLVVESEGHQIRGIVSTSDIARRLHIPLDIESKTTTFADIFKAIN